MSIKTALAGFVGKYGPHSKLIASSVLNVIAPGSGALISITETAIDAAKDIADDIDHKQWEERLMAKVQQGHAEVERLAKLIEFLSGPLAAVCDKAAVFADDPKELSNVISRAIATNPSLSKTLQEIQTLKIQFNVFQADIRKIARNQEEVKPVYDRMNRVADYFDELWEAGIKPREFVNHVSAHRQVANQIQQGNTANVDRTIDELHEATPKSASVCVLEAAAATREFNYLSAQKALTQAVKLRPGDRGLANVAKQVTVMATRTSKATKPIAKSPDQKRLQPGDILDGWSLKARRGAGGWGQVFQASKRSQVKAIKVMHPELAADRDFLQRFKKEIASLWMLPEHPNLLRIDKPETSFGFCMEHQTWYLVTEYIDGPTLESYLAQKGQIGEGLVRQVFLDLIDGLAIAHKTGIVHRDIKPSNMIFRKSDQKLVLVDFGLAVGTEDFGETKVGGISIQFAAPEQHYGGSATKASDVFSICAVIHYALNYGDPEKRAPHAFSSGAAPEFLRQALTRGMQMSPGERPQDAFELLQELKSTKSATSKSAESLSARSDRKQTAGKPDPASGVKQAKSKQTRGNSISRAKTESRKQADMNPPVAESSNSVSSTSRPFAIPVPPVKSKNVDNTTPIAASSNGKDSVKAKIQILENAQDSISKFENPPVASSEHKPVLVKEPKPRSFKKTILGSTFAILALIGLGIGGYFAYGEIVKAKRQTETVRKLHTISNALHAYHDRFIAFPPSDSDMNGENGYSWRVVIFNEFEENDIKNWNSKQVELKAIDWTVGPTHRPNRDFFIESAGKDYGGAPSIYHSPSLPKYTGSIIFGDENYGGRRHSMGWGNRGTDTNFVGITGENAFFLPRSKTNDVRTPRGRSLAELPDPGNTVVVIEVLPHSGVNSALPDDFSIEEAVKYILGQPEPVNALMADGTVQQIRGSPIAETRIRAMMTIEDDEIASAPTPDTDITVPLIKVPDYLKGSGDEP